MDGEAKETGTDQRVWVSRSAKKAHANFQRRFSPLRHYPAFNGRADADGVFDLRRIAVQETALALVAA